MSRPRETLEHRPVRPAPAFPALVAGRALGLARHVGLVVLVVEGLRALGLA